MPDPLIDFARRLKEKHPEYQDVPDYELAGRTLKKYPDYYESVGLAPQNGRYTIDQQQQFLRLGGWAEDVIPTMGAIAWPESAFGQVRANRVAAGSQNPSGLPEDSVGQLQVNWLAHASKLQKAGFTREDLFDPIKNAEAARMVYEERAARGRDPLKAWGVYATGKHKKYLGLSRRAYDAWKSSQKSEPLYGVSPNGGNTLAATLRVQEPAPQKPTENITQTITNVPTLNAEPPSAIAPDAVTYKPPEPVEGARPADEFTSKPSYNVPLTPFDKELTGSLGVIGNAGPEAQNAYIDWVRRNAQDKPEAAMADETNARVFLGIQRWLSMNPDAGPDEQVRELAEMGADFLNDPSTKGKKIPKSLHDAMLRATYTDEEAERLPAKIKQQRQQIVQAEQRRKSEAELQQQTAKLAKERPQELGEHIEWHFGRETLTGISNLPANLQRKIAFMAVQAANEDARKRETGQTEFTQDPAYQAEMRQRAGVSDDLLKAANIPSEVAKVTEGIMAASAQEDRRAAIRRQVETEQQSGQATRNPAAVEVETERRFQGQVEAERVEASRRGSKAGRATRQFLEVGGASPQTMLPREDALNVMEGLTGALMSTLKTAAQVGKYGPMLSFLPQYREAMEQLTERFREGEAGVRAEMETRPASGVVDEVRKGVGRGTGAMVVELPKLLAGGALLKAAALPAALNLPIQGALARADEGVPGVIKGAAGGLVYHYGGGVTGQYLGKVGNTLVWVAGPAAEAHFVNGVPWAQAISESIPMGVFAGVAGAKPGAEKVRVIDGEQVRVATPADAEKIVDGTLKVVPPEKSPTGEKRAEVKVDARQEIQREGRPASEPYPASAVESGVAEEGGGASRVREGSQPKEGQKVEDVQREAPLDRAKVDELLAEEPITQPVSEGPAVATETTATDQRGFVAFGQIYQHVYNTLRNARDWVTIDPTPALKRAGVSHEARVHASARTATLRVVKDMLSKVFPESYTDSDAMAQTIDVINKDNILGGYDTFVKNARAAAAAGETSWQKFWEKKAKNVGDAHDIARIEAEVKAAKNDPEIMANIQRWKEHVNPALDAMYNEMKRMDPATPREGRGRVFGARINLLPESRAADMASFGDLTKPIPEAVASNYRNPNVKKDPFMRAAKFTGQYSTNAEAVLTNVFGPRLNEVSKLRFYNALTEKGAAVELDYGEPTPAQIQGQKAVRMPIRVPETGEDGITRIVERNLYVRSDIVKEARAILNTDMALPQNPIANFLTAIQLAQLTDMTAHLKNIHTVLASAPATRAAFTDAVRRFPGIGTVDSVARIVKVSREVASDTPAIRSEIAEMAKMGLIRPEYPAMGTGKLPGFKHSQRLIHDVDTASRIVMNRFFTNLAESGRVKDTPENRTAFVQQIGEYNTRLMGPLMRAAKQSGLSPFIVAGRNFNRQGVRLLTGNPGVEASSTLEAVKMRAVNMTAGLVAATTLPAILNLMTVGNFGGRPGTPIGAWDLGREEDGSGRHSVIDLFQILGIRRGMRATGMGALEQGIREGRSWDQIAGQAVSDVISTPSHAWFGPGFQFAFTAATGKRWDLRGGPQAPEAYNVGGGGKQYIENARVAMKGQNPMLYELVSPAFTDPDEEGESYPWRVGKGIIKAPSRSIGITEAQDPVAKILIQDRRQRGAFSRTVAQDQAAKLKRRLREKEAAGEDIDEDIDKAIEEGRLTIRQVHAFEKNRGLSGVAVMFKYAPLSVAVTAFEKATSEQRKELGPLLIKKARRGLKNLPEAERKALKERINKVIE